MTAANWSSQAKIELSGRAPRTLAVFFWIWALLGFLIVTVTFMSMPPNVGVGTSAYVSACILYWIGGMIFFGLGAIVAGGRYEFIRPVLPTE